MGRELQHDPAFEQDILGDVQLLGIDRVANGEVDYLVLIKTKPNKQYAVSREFRRRVKACFEQNKIQAVPPGRIFVRDQGTDS